MHVAATSQSKLTAAYQDLTNLIPPLTSSKQHSCSCHGLLVLLQLKARARDLAESSREPSGGG